MTSLKLQSSDGQILEVSSAVVLQSEVIKTMLEDLGDVDKTVPIPIPNVNAKTLAIVIEWMESAGSAAKENLDFHQMKPELLFDLVEAADYLNVRGLLDEGCKNIAQLVKGKTSQEMMQSLNLNLDLSDR